MASTIDVMAIHRDAEAELPVSGADGRTGTAGSAGDRSKAMTTLRAEARAFGELKPTVWSSTSRAPQ